MCATWGSIVVVIAFVIAVSIVVTVSIAVAVSITVVPISVAVTVIMVVVAVVVIAPTASIISARTSISSAPTVFRMGVAIIFPHPTVPSTTMAEMDVLETIISRIALRGNVAKCSRCTYRNGKA
jgi:hypothetical protein